MQPCHVYIILEAIVGMIPVQDWIANKPCCRSEMVHCVHTSYMELMVGGRGRDIFFVGINSDKVPIFPQSNSHSGSCEQFTGHRKEEKT